VLRREAVKDILTRLLWTPLGYLGRALERATDALIERSNRRKDDET